MIFAMKKYRKVLFFIILVVSTIGMIIYRSEYLKLRYTFELGGLFNPPALPWNCLFVNESVSRSFDDTNLFSRPQNTWIKVNNFHLYSAFIKVVDGTTIGVALAIGDKKYDCPDYECHLWYTQSGSPVSYNGDFTCNVDSVENSTGFVYEFFCKIRVSDVAGQPNMYVIKDQYRKYFVPIHHRPKKEISNNAGLCVYPDMNAIERASIVEFLSFYQLIGFSDILIYDSGLQHRVLYLLEQALQSVNFLRSFGVLPWNFPFDDTVLAEEIIRRDCFYRISGHVELLANLGWNEYIFPVESHSTLSSLRKYQTGKKVLLKASSQICCIDRKDDQKSSDKSWPLIFRKTLCLSRVLNKTIILNPSMTEAIDVHLPSSELFVNEYALCGDTHVGTFRDKTPLRYLTNLMESKLLRIWRSGKFNEN